MTDGAADRRVARLFLSVLALYFAAQLVLRLLHGGAYELDEAELSVMTPGYAWGYGPQLPLYNWLQLSVFNLLGRSLFALAALKAVLLWGLYAGLFAGLCRFVTVRSAALAVLSLYLVPYLAYETQRATSHSTIMLCMASAFVATFFWAARRPGWPAYVAMGVAMLAGGVSKYNFWLVPVCLFLAALALPKWRHVVVTPRLGLSVAIAALLWFPYAWMANNPALAFASVGKIGMGAGDTTMAWPQGLAEAGLAVLSMVLFPVLIWGGALILGRSGPRPPMPSVARLLLVAAGLMGLLIAIGVVAADAGNVSAHWMLPLSVLLLAGLAVWLAPWLTRRGAAIVAGSAVALAVIVAGGLSYDRYKPGARKDLDFATLPSQIDAVAEGAAPLVIADFFVAGNLKRQRPAAVVAPYLARARALHDGQPILLIFRKNQPATTALAMQLAGWPEGDRGFDILAQGSFAVPYARGGDPRVLPYVFLRPTP